MNIEQMSREVAERMGWTPCEFAPNSRAHAPGSTCADHGKGGRADYWPDLTDARDREAVIEWLRERGFTLTTVRWADGTAHVVIIAPSGRTVANCPFPTIEEAFGRAFLGAVGAQG